ncbi:MAG: TauD/TfdA dioxygenase family protein, partial [Alphaproteobacteria bacterium]
MTAVESRSTEADAPFEIAPLTPAIGAEISGIDLGKPVDDVTLAALRQALLDWKVLFFRDQELTRAQHIAFARAFGDLEVHPLTPKDQPDPEVLRIVHDENFKGSENIWHSDVTWRPEPSLGSILRAVDVPETGGDTLFADMGAAFDGLPDAVKEKVCGRTAVHDFLHAFGPIIPAEKHEETRKKHPPQEHPVIRTHPETGRRLIYVNAAFTDHIKGLDREESGALLELLYAQARVPEVQCRFRWRKNSIAFWDNRICQHYAVSDYWPARREMERVTICGDRPFYR